MSSELTSYPPRFGYEWGNAVTSKVNSHATTLEDYALRKWNKGKSIVQKNGDLIETLDKETGKVSYDDEHINEVIDSILEVEDAPDIFVMPSLSAYDITAPITLQQSTAIRGVGGHYATATGRGTVFKLMSNCNVIEFINSTDGEHGNFTLENFSIDGNSRGYIGDGIHVEKATNPRVRNINIESIKGSSIYFSTVWGGAFNSIHNITANNCGYETDGKPNFYFAGPTYNGCQNLDIRNLMSSYPNYIQMMLDGADVTLHRFTSDGVNPAASDMEWQHIKVGTGSRGTRLSDLFIRGCKVAQNALEMGGYEAQLVNVRVEDCLGICFANVTSETQLTNVDFRGVDGGNPATNGFDVQGGFVQVANYKYKWVTDPDNGTESNYQSTNVKEVT